MYEKKTGKKNGDSISVSLLYTYNASYYRCIQVRYQHYEYNKFTVYMVGRLAYLRPYHIKAVSVEELLYKIYMSV